jgi:hypothetical protein
MHIRAILSACVLAAASLAAALSATAARSDAPPAPVPLPITGYYQMVVDSAHGHLFISQDSKFGSVEVYDFSGNPVAEIPAGAYVRGITLSPDGSTLYAAAMGEVSAISTATLQETVFYPLEPNETAVNVAVQSGKLWVSYTTLNSNTANIGDFDLSAVSKTFEAQPAMGSWPYNAPKLAADPGEHGVLVASDSLNGTPVATFDTGTDPVTPLAAQTYINSCSWGSQLAVLANGTRFAVACQALFPSLYDTANLTARVGSFQIDYGDSAIALAASHDGYVAAGSQQGGVFVFGSAGGAAISFHPLDSSLYLATSGLGWSADDSELFAVAQPKSTGSWVLQVIPNPTVPTPVVPVKTSLSIGTATGATTSGYGKKVQVFALLGHTFADRKVTISVTPAGEPAQLLFAGNVESYGGISVVHSLTRTSTFTVGYAGDAHNLPASAGQEAARGGPGRAEQARRMRQVRPAGTLQGQVVRQSHRLRNPRRQQHCRRHLHPQQGRPWLSLPAPRRVPARQGHKEPERRQRLAVLHRREVTADGTGNASFCYGVATRVGCYRSE